MLYVLEALYIIHPHPQLWYVKSAVYIRYCISIAVIPNIISCPPKIKKIK